MGVQAVTVRDQSDKEKEKKKRETKKTTSLSDCPECLSSASRVPSRVRPECLQCLSSECLQGLDCLECLSSECLQGLACLECLSK